MHTACWRRREAEAEGRTEEREASGEGRKEDGGVRREGEKKRGEERRRRKKVTFIVTQSMLLLQLRFYTAVFNFASTLCQCY